MLSLGYWSQRVWLRSWRLQTAVVVMAAGLEQVGVGRERSAATEAPRLAFNSTLGSFILLRLGVSWQPLVFCFVYFKHV
jgi:hypothetical protein